MKRGAAAIALVTVGVVMALRSDGGLATVGGTLVVIGAALGMDAMARRRE